MLGDERLDRLREQQHAREHRDLIAREANRMAKPAPVLVHVRDRARRCAGESERARDLRASFASRLNDLPRHVRRARNAQEMRDARNRIATHAAVARRALGAPPSIMPVDESHLTLHVLVVGAEQGRHAGRIAGATGVLEQRRIVERGHRIGVELALSPDPHRDERRAQRVSRALSFGEVERIRERRQHFSEANGARRRRWTRVERNGRHGIG